MKKTRELETYSTSSLFEASALNLSIKPLRIEKSDNKFKFIYLKEPAEKLASDYWTGNLCGNLQEYVNNLNALKDLIFAARRGSNLSFIGQ